MKRWLKLFFYTFIGLFALVGFGFSAYVAYDVFFNPMSYLEENIKGRSMEQYGFVEGGTAKVYTKQECLPGDNCLFDCFVDKCKCPKDMCVIDNSESYSLKRLVSIKDGCYWFEGNPEPYIADGLEYPSFDSRTFGCLMSDEFKMVGVVTPADVPLERAF